MFPNPAAYATWQSWASALITELELAQAQQVETFVANKTCTPGTIAAGASVVETVTVPRAELGMFTEAAFSLDVDTVQLLSAVTATDEVTVTFVNFGTGSVTLNQGILRVRVLPLLAGE